MQKKKIVFTGILLLILLSPAIAQEEQRPQVRPVSYYIGFQPGISLAGWDSYDRPLVNINLIPLTLEYAVNRHIGVRFHSIWDLQIRPEFPTVLSTVGLEIAIPYYFSLKNTEEGHRGFYAAPVITPEFYRLNQFYSLGLALEAGYSILFGRGWSFTIAGQAGVRLQIDPDNPYMRTLPYSAPRLALGYWF